MAQTNVQVFSGNVGIGTDGPVAKLHIKTGTTLSSSIESLRSNAAIRISAAGDNNDCMTFGLFDDVNGSGNNPIGYIQHSWDSDSDIGRPLMLNPRGGSVGIGTTNPVGQLEVHGQGQTTTTSFSQTGNMGGILTVKSSGGSPGDGGGIMFGANQGYFAAIKGTLSDGTDNTSGELMFCTRNPPSSSTMQVNMVINRAGNVGIGTTGPAYPLHVMSDTVPQVWIEGAVNSDAVIQSGSGPSYRNTYHRIRFKHYALPGDAFKAQNSINFEVSPGGLAPVSAMTINGWGRVGIGTDTPGGLLDLRASASDPSVPTVHIGDNAADYGDYGMVNLVRNPTSAGSKTHLAFIRNGNTVFGQGFYNNTNTFGFWPSFSSVANTPTMTFTTGGSVGIGLTDPTTYKLDILDHIRIRGNYPALYFSEGTGAATQPAFRIFNDGASQDDGNNYLAIQKHTTGGVYDSIIHAKLNGHVGIGTNNPNYTLDVNGATRVGQQLYVGPNSANQTSPNTLYFGGLYGDYGYENCVIENRIWSSGTEKRELLLFSGNDTEGGPGSDRIRLRGNTILFDTYNVATTDRTAERVTMKITQEGYVGIGINLHSPAKCYVKTEATASKGAAWSPGDFVVSHGVGTNAPSQSLGVGIGVDYNGNDGNSQGYIWCIRPNLSWNYLKLLANKIELQAITANGVILAGGTVVTSDDRLKTDEALIKNATSTLMKLKPQTYNKHKNLPNSGDEHTLDDAGIPYNKSVMEAGLMVQDVYYDAPELKHLVLLSDDAIPQETKPEEPVPGDIQQDPDYSDWGVSPSSLNYTGLTPYIIKSIQEINMELPRHKTKIDGIPFSNISAYHNLIVSKDSVVRLSNTYNDKTVYGVISETEASTDDSEVLVNYQGDGKVWVINTSNIEAGDYITTSNVGGYGMKQGTDFTMNYTLAKSTIACDFTQPHITEKRKVQELRDVTYWSVTTNVDISKERYDFIASNNVNLVSTTAEIHYSNVSVEELTGNTVYSNITTQEYSSLESDEQNNYIEVSETKYHLISTREYSLDPRNKTSNVIVRQEYVDALDANGQLQWEDTGNTVPMYELRYLNSDGIQTDEANAVYKAALIDCTIKTG